MMEQGFGQTQAGEEKSRFEIPPAIYERLLKTAAKAPGRLDDIEQVMSLLDKEIVTDEFRMLLESVRAAANKGRRKK